MRFPVRIIPCAVAAATLLAAAPARADTQVTIGDATVAEAGFKLSFPLTVTSDAPSVTIAVATRPDSAIAPDDFTARLAVFTIPTNGGTNTAYRLEIPVTDDKVFEPTETMTVAYRVIPTGEVPPVPGTPGVGATPDLAAEPTAATGTITDDDAPATKPGASTPPPPTAPPATTQTPVSAASKPSLTSVAKLPSAKQCVSRRNFQIRLRSPKGAKIASATVKVRGKTVAARKGKRVTAPIDLRGLPKGRFKVSITVTLADGRIITGSRTYRTCAAKKKSPSSPKV